VVDMKEIRIELWDTEEQKMIPLVGLTGGNDYYNEYYLTLACQFPSRFIKRLCAGHKDDKDRCVYEGDIIRLFTGETSDVYDDKVVIWNDDKFVLKHSGGNWGMHTIEMYHGIVIGNVYENRDLLKP
jgi:hypothetical protein